MMMTRSTIQIDNLNINERFLSIFYSTIVLMRRYTIVFFHRLSNRILVNTSDKHLFQKSSTFPM